MSENIEALTVEQLTNIIERQLKVPQLQSIAVVGEVTGFRKQSSSGHIYFRLSDNKAGSSVPAHKVPVLNCSFFKFRQNNNTLTFNPRDGDEVVVVGSVDVYRAAGQYSFLVERMINVGEGTLLKRIEALKKKLIQEGVIDPQLRKPLPRLPRRLGIVTGARTAALSDILKQVRDRYPHVEIVLAPAVVQGQSAPASIAAALKEIAKPQYKCDVIIVGRGGGSLEDLMAFNDEMVARAIYECPLPVISGVGHQVDHLISDDVADVAAATPTDAAKKALPEIDQLMNAVQVTGNRLNQLLSSKLDLYRQKLDHLGSKPFYRDPGVLLQDAYRRIDDLEARALEAYRDKVYHSRDQLNNVPQIEYLLEKTLTGFKNRFSNTAARLEAFSPLATLKRGYSLTTQGDAIIRSVEQLDFKKKVRVKLGEGSFNAMPVNESSL